MFGDARGDVGDPGLQVILVGGRNTQRRIEGREECRKEEREGERKGGREG